ncbi:MAG: tetratricopeptide repeat protein, partial [Hyphomonadaceae bacterium]|nr:tetratricopeptide repeat protein [Hyphomonadaceae bacterium]
MRADQLVQQAAALQRQGRLQEAVQLYSQALQLDPNHADALHMLGILLSQAGQPQNAVPMLERALQLKPGVAEIHANLGVALRRAGRAGDALARFDRATQLDPKLAEAHVGYATALFELGRLDDALARFDTALVLAPEHASAHCNRGSVLHMLKRPADALAAFERAVALAPSMAEAHANRGNALIELGRYDEAVAACDEALRLRPGYAAALAYRGFALLERAQPQDALASFEAALRANANDVRALSGRGRAMAALSQPTQALVSYDAALARAPGDAQTHFHKALALYDLGRLDEALQCLDRALSLDASVQGAHHWRANILGKSGKREQALKSYRKEFELHPEADYALGHYLLAKLGLCDWSGYDALVETLCTRTAAGGRAGTPFELMLVSDSGALQLACAAAHAAKQKSTGQFSEPARGGGGGRRIRVGYFSSDFNDHPVTHLIAGVLAAHDRERFEVFAYALGDKRDAYTDRIRASVDSFADCKGIAAYDIATHARIDGIDVAIDLNGYTAGAQTSIFAARAAPVQASYIGYLGTLGAPFMDYLIVDPVIAPRANRAHFSEKLISLPWYQCNETAEMPIEEGLGRAHYGLADGAFVFGSFNNVSKLTPEMFAAWMRVLKRTPGSVLWMFAAEAAAR